MKSLADYRSEVGISQRALAEKAGIGPNSVPVYEACKRLPVKEQVEKMAAALGMDAAELYVNHYHYCMRKDLTIFDTKENAEFKKALDYLLELAFDKQASGAFRIACIEAARTVLKEYFS